MHASGFCKERVFTHGRAWSIPSVQRVRWCVCRGHCVGGRECVLCKLVLAPPEPLAPPPPSLIASLVLIEGLSHASALAVWSELPPPGRDKPLPLPLPALHLPIALELSTPAPLTFLGTFLPPSGPGLINHIPPPRCQRLPGEVSGTGRRAQDLLLKGVSGRGYFPTGGPKKSGVPTEHRVTVMRERTEILGHGRAEERTESLVSSL